MHRLPIGKKLYLSVMAIFLIFAVAFIAFQQRREKEFKIEMLNLQLQDYNKAVHELLMAGAQPYDSVLTGYLKRNPKRDLRLTLVTTKGIVIYDNKENSSKLDNHARRKEIAMALKNGSGYVIDRRSATMKKQFFYSATYFPDDGLVIRSALPYNNNLTKSLSADQHYIWFALVAIIILTLVLYRFTNRLGENIRKLRVFASRADHGESLDTDDLMGFPDDELGEIAEKIIKIYWKLEKTKKEQDVLKRQLTQNIAHELKTPVASIQGYLETILDNPNIDEKTQKVFLQRSFAQSQRLTSLLQDISTLNRMDDARDYMDFDVVDISRMVSNITHETALQLQEKGMTFRDKLQSGIRVHGNQSLLYSVFRNLTDNAIAYAGEGKTITLSASEDEDYWYFVFQDNGVGVPPEHLPRLFERFYRVDKGRSRKMGGTGLGLAIVKNAVQLHGGRIKVENRQEGGLRFSFSLKK